MHRIDCPPDPEYGQVWFDDRDAKCKVLTATAFMVVPTPEHVGPGGMMGGAEVSKPKEGDVWYGDKKLKLIHGTWHEFNAVGDTKWENGTLLTFTANGWMQRRFNPDDGGYSTILRAEPVVIKKPSPQKPIEPERPEKSRVFTFD